MKNLITFLCLASLSACFAQTDINNTKVTTSKVNSLSYMADKIEELESINWEDIKEMFNNNNKNDTVELTFGIDFKKSKMKFKSSIKVSGEIKDLDSLIAKSKKGVVSLIKISKKYNQ